VGVGIFTVLAWAQVPPGAYANFEGSQTNPIRLSADGTRLFAVNTADARLSVFDVSFPANPALIAEIPVGIEPVSVNPRTNDEVWVVNQESDSISIVSVSKGIVTDTIYVKDEPADVVFSGSNVFVSISRSNQIAVFNATTHALVQSIPVFGGNPRSLAVSLDGTKVYAAFALSGNRTTIIPAAIAPLQTLPPGSTLPAPPQVALIVDARNPVWSFFNKFQMPDNDIVAIDTTSLNVSGYISGVGTINLGIAVRPITGEIYVANTDARNLIRFEPNLRGHWVDNRVTRITATGQPTPYDLNPSIDYTVLPNPAARAIALAQPTAIVFHPSAAFMYVAAFGTDRVGIVDANGNVLGRIELEPTALGSTVDPAHKRGPRGLALGGRWLYVLNRISNTISLVDTTQNTVTSEIPVGTFDPTPTVIRNGRGFLYDAKLSGNGTGSCASCHIDADMDHLAWDLGDPFGQVATVVQAGKAFQMHPMKGPMATQTLRGLLNTAPYHWRGEKQDFSAFNAAFDKLMGGSQLSSPDMAAYTAFINTIVFQPNPNQNLDRSLPTSLNGGNAVNGQDTFLNAFLMSPGIATCSFCHPSNPGPGTNLKIQPVHPGAASDDQPLKNPHLRNMYQKLLFTSGAPSTIDGFGINHTGEVPTLHAFFSSGNFAKYSAIQKADMTAYMISFDTGMAPAAGYTRTVTPANVSNASVQQDLTMLVSQATAGNIDLIVKGTINGQIHGLLFQAVNNNFATDTTGLGPFTSLQLGAKILAGDTLTFMGVPPGSGVRMGIDRDLNGVLDGDQH
jgi:YVTN family beta-propeller protein